MTGKSNRFSFLSTLYAFKFGETNSFACTLMTSVQNHSRIIKLFKWLPSSLLANSHKKMNRFQVTCGKKSLEYCSIVMFFFPSIWIFSMFFVLRSERNITYLSPELCIYVIGCHSGNWP